MKIQLKPLNCMSSIERSSRPAGGLEQFSQRYGESMTKRIQLWEPSFNFGLDGHALHEALTAFGRQYGFTDGFDAALRSLDQAHRRVERIRLMDKNFQLYQTASGKKFEIEESVVETNPPGFYYKIRTADDTSQSIKYSELLELNFKNLPLFVSESSAYSRAKRCPEDLQRFKYGSHVLAYECQGDC